MCSHSLQNFVLKNRIAFFRAEFHLTQEELASRVGISVNTLSKVEHGSNVRLVHAILIAKALDTKFESVFYLE